MRTRRIAFVSLAAALLAACQSSAPTPTASPTVAQAPKSDVVPPAPVRIPATPVGQKFEAWLAAVNAANRALLTEVHAGEGEKDAAKHTDMDMTVAERSGGFAIDHIEDASRTSLAVVMKGRKSGNWVLVEFRVTAEPPHLIETILLQPTESPAEAAGQAARPFDERARADIIDALILELRRSYVFPEQAAAMEKELRANAGHRAYDAISSRMDFAQTLTKDLRSVSHDMHLRVESRAPGGGHPPRGPKGEGDGDAPRVFGEVKRLDGNVAFVEIVTFGVPRDRAADEVREVMRAAADTDALVVDVRNNGGGDPEAVALVCSYLFGSEPILLNSFYSREDDKTVDFSTNPDVPGAKFGPTKPIYVLTSKRTFSAAEEFAYDLQAQKRAVIIGETTGGGAHPGKIVGLPFGFVAFVPSGRAINPITHTDWEGVGVKPDVAISADAAPEAALSLARSRLAAKSTETKPKAGVAARPKK